jgi:hypothetical protein
VKTLGDLAIESLSDWKPAETWILVFNHSIANRAIAKSFMGA